MYNRRTIRRVVVALALLVAIACQGTWALAGTTGALSGQVTTDTGAPLAGAAVKISSPSQTTSTTSDAGGHFSFLSLAPDTYVATVSKDGYVPAAYQGITVFADQSLTLSFQLAKSLKNIANVTARSATSLVKPGTTADVYSVNAATQNAVQGIGGGGNLDSAYSAIYSQPGVNSQIGNYGFGQVFYIRGSSYSQVGYEYDGVPVNRAFDNYNANSLSNLGAQETEIYTGGSPAGGSSSTLAGYINQVIKTGTFPGYGVLNGGAGYPGFYHKAGAEAGGSTPDRLFSYYAGIQGANQTFRFLNNQDGGNIAPDGSNSFGISSGSINASAILFAPENTNGPWSTCGANDKGAPKGAASFEGAPTCNWYAPFVATGFLGTQGQTIDDRENVVNLHFGIPHKHDAGKDDVQLLFYNFSYLTYSGDTIDNNGGMSNINSAYAGYNGLLGPKIAGPYADYCSWQSLIFGPGACVAGPSPVPYMDSQIFSGATFGQNAATAKVIPYFAPSSPTDRAANSGIPTSLAGSVYNDGSIVKVQYQKNIGSSAFVRVMGYTFYSDWLQNAQNKGPAELVGSFLAGFTGFGYPSPDYELATHSRGVQFDAEDQINAQNVVSLTGNYTTGTAARTNNEYFAAPPGVTNLVAGNTCYDATPAASGGKGLPVSCLNAASQGTYAAPTAAWTSNKACANLPGTPACTAGASFLVTTPGGYGPYNTVSPKFSTIALQDEWRPSDRWLVNAGVRFENYTYDLADMSAPEFAFWFNQARLSYCYDPGTGQPVLTPVSPTTSPAQAGPIVAPNTLAGQKTGLCYQAGTLSPLVAPSGQQAQHPLNFTNVGANTLSSSLWSPRIGGTFTADADTVFRFNYGRYTQPTAAAYEQYSNLSGAGAAKFDFQYFYGLGFNTPAHANQPQSSNNYDLSFEKHLKGTDWSFKLSPFYRYTTNQLVTVSLGGNFASAINAATQQSSGIEVAIQKGDPSRNGLSGQFSYTYTNARMKFYRLSNGSNTIDVLNNYIRAYNGLTSFCETHGASPQCPSGMGTSVIAAPCYNPASPTGPNGSNAPVACGNNPAGSKYVTNPYYNAAAQPLMDPNAYYQIYANNPPDTAPDNVLGTAISPNVFAGFLNYKRNKFTATVPAVLNQGTAYGGPTAIVGLDPRDCGGNEAGSHALEAGLAKQFAPLPDYQTCGASLFTTSGNLAIPNPQTHGFDGLGQFRNPWQLNVGLQLGYDITPNVHATLLFANIINTCFGGDAEPWTAAYPPGSYDCAYGSNGANFVGGTPGTGFFYGPNGQAPQNGTAGYPNVLNQSYAPVPNALPLQIYGNIQIKL